MTSNSAINETRHEFNLLNRGNHLDGLVALLTAVITVFYILAPASRFGMMIALFIPVCLSGFYLRSKRSALLAAVCSLVVCFSFSTGILPDWPKNYWMQGLTLTLWTVTLGTCSVCVSGMSSFQAALMANMQEKHVSERLVDGLTGLKNRLAFDYEFAKQLEWSQRCGTDLVVLMVDVDHFKKFNDRYGHKAGDFVLREVAKIMQDSVRDSDVVVRYGGEEFAILMPDAKLGVAQNAAERIRSLIEQKRFYFEAATMRLTASVGIAAFEQEESGPELMDRADAALYTSKHAGRNCIHYSEGEVFRPFGSTLGLYSTEKPEQTDLDEISDDAYTEKVTGLPHRRVFQEELKRRVAECTRYNRQLTLIFVSVQGYSEVIAMGLEAEASLLAILAEKLRACLRDCDLGCRIGHYEFAALLPDTSIDNAKVPASRIEREITECNKELFRGSKLSLRANIGITQLLAGDDVVSIAERARKATRNATESNEISLIRNADASPTEDQA